MKLLTLSFAVAFAVYFAHPPHDCDELLETEAGHVEHCQLCLGAAAFTAVLEHASPTLPDYDIVGYAAGVSQPGHPRIQVEQHRNRAPPLP